MRDESSPGSKLLLRFNLALVKGLLALWPEENKAWGMAFAAECVAIESPQKQFRWLLGGIAVLLRECFNSFLKSLGRPITVGPADMPGDGPALPVRGPRTPRIALALLTVVFVTLFTQPATRAVFRAVSEAYTEEGWDPAKWSEVRRIQSLAEKNLSEKNRDAELLAFASLLYSDQGKRLTMADAAIRSDPVLAWIDFENVVLPLNDISNPQPLSEDRVRRLVSSDPDNGFLYLLRAESVAATYRRADAQNDPKALQMAGWGSAGTRDPQWLAAMDAAFKSPRYDAYDRKLFLLSRDVVERYSINDPRIFSATLGRRPVYHHAAIDAYTRILLSRASDAQRAGDIDTALRLCSQISDFAQRLRPGNFFQLETWIANDIESRTFPLLGNIYENAGRHQEARDLAVRVQENRDERRKLAGGRRSHSAADSGHWSSSEWRAVLMQSSVLTIWILVPLSLASIPVLWVVRGCLRIRSGLPHSLLCLFADFCPSLLALASTILFIIYKPVDTAYRQVLRNPFSPHSYDEFSRLVFTPFSLPMNVQAVLASFSGPHGRFLLWSVTTAILILLVVVFWVRQFRSRAESE